MPPRRRKIALLLLAAFLAGLGFLLYIGHALTAPKPGGHRTSAPDLYAESVEIPSLSGSRLRGQLCGFSGRGAWLILMHGVRSNRLSLVRRVRFFREQGISVLLFDFQAHGDSPGEHFIFGFLDAPGRRSISPIASFPTSRSRLSGSLSAARRRCWRTLLSISTR